MAPKSSSSASSGGIGGWLKFLAILLGVLTPVYYLLEQNLHRFYIFDLDQLRDMAKRGIDTHGNDTRAIVKYIVDELSGEVRLTSYVNTDEEWMFNNAGGAMGAMYIIHASALPFAPSPSSPNHPALTNTPPRRHHRVPHHLRHRRRHRGPLGPPHSR